MAGSSPNRQVPGLVRAAGQRDVVAHVKIARHQVLRLQADLVSIERSLSYSFCFGTWLFGV